MIELLYEDEDGWSPFAEWREELDAVTRARVSRALSRVVHGNTSNVKGVGGGVSEVKMDFGPGYRVYFGRDGAAIIVLLGGGTKKRQQRDIEDAQMRWTDYKRRKGGGA
jgi:putative addiction module killer protein